MLKKLVLLALLLPLISACSKITANSSYDEIVDSAYKTKLEKSNTHGVAYTYNIPKNGQLISSTKYFDNIKIEKQNYNLNVNVPQYLIDKRLLTVTDSGDYEVYDINKQYENYIYGTSRILIADQENLTIEENLARAQSILDELIATGDVALNFANFAQTYSNDVETAQNGGYVGTQTTDQMSSEYLKAIVDLQPGQISQLVSTPNGQQIILLNSVEELNPKDTKFQTQEFYVDETNLEYSYYDEASDSTLKIVKNDNNFYNIVVSNNYSLVESTVSKEYLNETIYNAIMVQRSVKINDDIALAYVLNPSISTDKTEIINLNNSNTQLENVISNKYQYEFAASFDDNFTDNSGFNNSNIFKFNSTTMTNDEYNAYVESKVNKDN